MNHRSARAGAALIIAIILLAALVLLGLPFLFAQSTSLAGTRSFAHQQQAISARETAERVGLGVASEVVRAHFQVGGTQAATSFANGPMIGSNPLLVDLGGSGAKRFAIDLDALYPAPAAPMATTLIDEQGKLDVNHLGAAGWTRLLNTCNILDWDDDHFWDSEDLSQNNGSLADGDDGDTAGELAEALAYLRFQLPGQRITALEELLDADPRHNQDPAIPASAYGAAGPSPNGSFGFRRRLTRAELEILRPHLTLHLLAQGRLAGGISRSSGVIDLGTTIAQELINGRTRTFIDSNWLNSVPQTIAQQPATLATTVGPGTVIAWHDAADASEPVKFAPVVTGDPTSGMDLLDSPNYQYVFKKDMAVGIQAAPAVNIHQAHGAVLTALAAVDVAAASSSTYGGLPIGDVTAGPPTQAYHYLNPLETGVERPAVDIASFGVVAIEAAGAANDPLGRQTAQQRRRVVAQAVPQEAVLERRWTTQGEWHALLAGRSGSLVETWPKPIRRVRDMAPDESPASATNPVGVRPAVMPNVATGYRERLNVSAQNRRPSHGNWDWRLPLGLGWAETQASVLTPQINGAPGAPVGVIANLRPDGLRLAGAPLALPLTVETGANDWGILRGSSQTIHDLSPRHLSFWITPEADFDSASTLYPLLESRIDAAATGQRLNGSFGSNELQNHFSLHYDRKQQLLALVLAPPAIEHPHDSGPMIRSDDAATQADVLTRTHHIDERSLVGTQRLAPRQPGPVEPVSEASSPFAAITRLYKPNRIVHLYGLPDQDGRPYFRKGRASHIQVVIAGDRPGMFRVIVDNIVGKDVSRKPPASAASLPFGDHLTLPAMPLKSAIPMKTLRTSTPPQSGGALLGPMTIEVDPVLGLTAAQLYPARGMLRIDDEYFSYESISGNTFEQCVRGQRQNTEVNAGYFVANNTTWVPQPEFYWPNTQEHLVGAMVVPGGYRLNPGTGTLYRGGCALRDPLPNGDPQPTLATVPPSNNPYRWSIWARLDTTHPPMVPDTADPIDPTLYFWPADATSIPIRSTGVDNGVFNQFPPSGIVRFKGLTLHYSAKGTNSLDGITDLTTANLFPGRPANIAFPTKGQRQAHTTEITPIQLLSIALDDTVTSTEAGRYDQTWDGPFYANGEPVHPMYLQVRHPNGRIEWLTYYHLATVGTAAGTQTYILNHHSDGWLAQLSRGRQRTGFCSTTPLIAATEVFPAGSLAIPVQTNLGGIGHYVATGDVVTLMPKFRQLGQRPQQVLVRYAAMDGYDTTGLISANDTKNEYFAFDGPLPDIDRIPASNGAPPDVTINAADYELLCWPCWSARDLTPQNPIGPGQARAGHLPRIDLLATCMLASLDEPRLSADLAVQVPSESTAYLSAREKMLPAVVDGLAAGGIPGLERINPLTGNSSAWEHVGIQLTAFSNVPTTNVAAVGTSVDATHGIFTESMGLVVIAGETFAYRSQTTQRATLIGRGLLDLDPSLGISHDIAAGPVVPMGGPVVRPLLTAYTVPIGPVAELQGSLAGTGNWFEFVDTVPTPPATAPRVNLDAPAVLLCDTTGDPAQAELLIPIGPNGSTRFTTAPWLRGLYNTTPSTGTIAIGWWPRYPSALPAAPTPEQVRSRSFAWVGMPFSLHGARFDSASVGMESALVAVADLDPGQPNPFTINARASAHGLLWPGTLPLIQVAPPTSTDVNGAFDVSDAFAHDHFTDAVNGAELRLTWHYKATTPSSNLLAIAEAGGRAPMIQSARLRAVAPATVLAVEGAR